MVKSIGIDPGDRMAHVVALDGSYKKARLVHVHSAPIGASNDPMRPDVVAEAVREALDEHGMKGEVTLGHPCREAVLRTLELPFKGVDAIKKVVKSEIEGEIYTHSVDDMVVDFHELGEASGGGGTRVLVAAVPKVGLRNQLTSLSAQNVEPTTVDLDTMALWRAADWVGAFDPDEDGDVETPEGPPVHAVVDLGARSVKVILTAGDELVEMRVLRLGDAVVADQIARHHGMHGEQALLAVDESLRSGHDVTVGAFAGGAPPVDEAEVVADEPAADVDPAAAAAAAELPVPASETSELITYAEVDAAHTKYLQRLARELTRFLTASGLTPRIRSLWISGSACRARGVQEMLEAVFGTAPQELDVLAHLSHDLDEEQAQQLSPQLAIAVGLALGRFGGPEGLQLRQEDLALSGGFDRVKFPLAIACMVGLLALFVYANTKTMELSTLELRLGQRAQDPNDPKRVVFHGLLHPIFQAKWLRDSKMFSLREPSGRISYSFDDLVADVDAAPVHRRVQIVRDQLRKVAAQKQKQSGIYEDVSLESGLAVLVRWSEMMKSVESQLGRYLVPDIDLDMDSGKLRFKVAFRGEDFRARKSAVLRAMELEIGKPDSPFKEPDRGSLEPDEKPFRDAEERGVTGAYYDFELPIKEQFPAFGPSGRIGALSPADVGVDRDRKEVG